MISKEIILKLREFCDHYGWLFDKDSSEFTFQFRFGWFLNSFFPNKYIIDFETNTRRFGITDTRKKEMDILITQI